ncbi:MAG: 2OG-Fe(II) oxygenase [Nannocystaceae bacterium]|nr:2OG-Fe(II) oxygenase [Myxococcales bacterium]
MSRSTYLSLQLRREFPFGERLCEDPLVHRFDAFVSDDECAHIIAVARPGLRRGEVSGEAGGVRSPGRSNDLTWVPHELDAVTSQVTARVADIVGLPSINAESMQVIRYGPGQEYRHHYDAYDLRTLRGQRCCDRGGQRMVTTLIYLSDVEEGGATGFPRLGLEVYPRRGALLVFHNCVPGTTDVHPQTIHAGLPVIRGEKWAVNLWFRAGAYR